MGSRAHWLRLLSLPTPWPRPRAATVWFAVISVVGVVSLLLPRTTGWTGDFLHSEDGQVFLSEYLEAGLGTLFQTYAGYLHLVPRAVTIGCDAIAGPDGFAGCIDGGPSLVRVAAMAVAFPVLAAYARSWRWGLGAAAAAFLFLPAGQQEVLGQHHQPPLVPAGGSLLRGLRHLPDPLAHRLRDRHRTARGPVDPMPLLLAPLAIWRIIELRGWARLPSVAVLAGGLVHLVMLDPSARGERGGFGDLLDVPSTDDRSAARSRTAGHPVGHDVDAGPHASNRSTAAISTLVLTGVLAGPRLARAAHRRPCRSLRRPPGRTRVRLPPVTLSFPASYIALADIWNPLPNPRAIRCSRACS